MDGENVATIGALQQRIEDLEEALEPLALSPTCTTAAHHRAAVLLGKVVPLPEEPPAGICA